MESLDFNLNQVYYIKTKNEFISDEVIKKVEKESNKLLIVNALSNTKDTLLLPIYKEKHKLELKKSGLSKEIGVGDLKFLKFLIEKEISKFDLICFGLTGLHYEAVEFLKNYFASIVDKSNKTFVLIDYNPEFTDCTISTLRNED